MHDLTAQVTSSLLPFPGVTLNALGEDEITLDSVLQGKFTVGRSGLAWLACGPHLEAVHAMTGERLSAYTFSGGGEHPPCILAAKDFSWLKRSGLLIGLEEAEGSVLCLYDLGLSRVVKSVVIPGRITAIEPLVSYGGASTSTQHLHQSLRWFFGIAAVGTDLGHVLLVDLCLDDLSCSQSELEASDLQVVTKSPTEIPKLREVSSREGRHLCLQLNGATGVGATALQYIARTNQLAVGFSDGYLHLWNMKALKKEYHSQLEGGKVPVNAFTFQEPENDPRNCCYLWAVQSSQDLEGDMVSLRLLQLAFGERKCSASGKILYEGLEYCEERYSQELSGTAFPLRAQATNTRLLNCQTIEKFRPHHDRDDSMNEVSSPDTSVSIFIWQVKAYGQGTPATFIGVFDINRWYHAQMPDSLRAGESLQNCPYLAVWSLDTVMQMVSPNVLLDVLVNDRSLSRGLPYTCPPPEQYFNPTTYNFDATCLLNTGIVHLTCSGYQKETLSFLKKAAPCSSEVISTSYSRCLMSGLLSSRLADTQSSSLTQEEQLDAILCTAVETSSLGLITGCIKQWTAEEQPGSALNLRYILDWAWNKVVQTKEELDGICAPLFDSSSNFTDPQTMQLLQHSQRLLTNLSTIFNCLLSEAHELTQKGLVGLMNKNVVSGLISKYAQVVLWFCRTGLLPEGSDEDALQISRPFYSHSIISSYYTIRREELERLAKGKWCADCLMIDGLVGQCGERLVNLWKRDEEGTGQYPPPTLHALLDIYLLDNIDEAAKHAIVIYLLLDVMYAFSNKEGASVESFPTAFAIPIGLVKLIQGLWLLDHHDHQSAFELLLHPAASQCQFEWQHERVLQALMCQGQHSEALRYLHVTKPAVASTSQAKLCLSVLLHNRCLIEAWSLARQHSNRLNISELLGFLYETCQELGLMKELLKLPLGLSEQEGLEKFLQGTGGLQNRELLMVHYLQQANYIPALQLNHSLKMNLVNERDPKLKEQSTTRNSILDQYGKVLPRVQRKLAMERSKPYQRPLTIHKEVSRPQPLSTITKRSTSEKVISRAGFINNVLTKIEEVWIGKGDSPQSSPAKSPKATQIKSPSPKPSSALPEPFLGTPITMSAKRKSRLMKLVVQPSCQMPQPLQSPLRPPSSWVSPKTVSKAPELSLLQTPQVVKRARALAASGPVFAGFTPQSILRSSLRPTPVATPSASPGRSITPPPRKENRITFIEEADSPEIEKNIRWTNGEASENEIHLLTRGALLSKTTRNSWSLQAEDEEEEDVQEEKQQSDVTKGGSSSPHQSVSNSPSLHEETEENEPSGSQLVLSFETSHTSVRSTDTTLEYYDAPLSEEQEDDKHVESDNGPIIQAPAEDGGIPQSQVQTEDEVPEEPVPQEESEGLLEEHKVDVNFEDITETDSAQDITNAMDEKMNEEVLIEASADTPSEQDKPNDGCNELIKESDSQAEDVCEQSKEPTEQCLIPESTEGTEALKPARETEPTNEPEPEVEPSTGSVKGEPEVEPSTDLTDFVQRHLFGDDLTSPLTRSGIHSVSLSQTSVISESVDQEAEEHSAPGTAPVFSSQKSTTSITSSEPTGTDSHSVFSVNDSEELSRPVSEDEGEDEEYGHVEEGEEEEEEEEEEDGEEEEEDSGSEVEIIEEIQVRPPPQSSEFAIQGHTHFLPQQEAEAFSSEMKNAEDGEGEVVMVHLGTDEGDMDQDEEAAQAASYLELQPSTTLLVPLELVEGQDALVNATDQVPNDIFQTDVPNDHKTESQSSFSLTLDLEEDVDKETELNLENNLSTGASHAEVKESSEEAETLSEVQVVEKVETNLPEPEVIEEKELESPKTDTPIESKVQGPKDEAVPENILENEQTKNTEQEAVPENMLENEQTENTEQEAVPENILENEQTENTEQEAVPENILENEQTENTEQEAVPENILENEQAENTKQVAIPENILENEKMENIVQEVIPENILENEQTENTAQEVIPENTLENEQIENTEPQTQVEAEDEQEDTEMQLEDQKAEVPESTDELLEVCKDKEMSDAPVEGELVEDKTKPSDEPPEPLREDPCSSNSEDVQASETDQATVSVEEKEEETESRDKEKTKKGRSKKQEPVVASVQEIDDAPEEQPVLQIPGSGRRNEASYTPTRRTTRARAVTFISPVPEEVHDEEGKPEQEVKMEQDQEPTVAVATSPGRSTKRSKQVKESIIGTPRRSTRRTQPEPEPEPEAPTEQKEDKVENVSDNTVSSTTRTLSPGRKWGSQRNPSRTSKQHHSEEDEASPEAKVKQEMAETHAVAKSSARGKTPTKRKAAQSTTPLLLEVLKEEVEEQELVSTTPAKRSSRKTKAASLLSTAVEENDKKHQTPNLGRTTRQSNRITPSVYPQSVKRRGVKGQDQSEPEPKQEADALRKTKKKLWDHPEEEQPLLDHPLEVPSETPVADVLIKRLQDEEQKQEVTKSPTRTSKRLTKSVVDPEPPFENSVVFDPDDKSGPGESSFIYSPSRRRTRAKAAESPSQIAPVTRSRRNVSTVDAVPPEDEMAVEVEEAKVSNTRKTSKRTANDSGCVLSVTGHWLLVLSGVERLISLSALDRRSMMRPKHTDMQKDCVRVAVRVRPFNKRERDAGSRCIISMVPCSITIQDPREPQNRRSFCFDNTYWSHSGFIQDNTGKYLPEDTGGRYADQDSVFHDLGEGILENSLQTENTEQEAVPENILENEQTENTEQEAVPENILENEQTENTEQEAVPENILENEQAENTKQVAIPENILENEKMENIVQEVIPENILENEQTENTAQEVIPENTLENEQIENTEPQTQVEAEDEQEDTEMQLEDQKAEVPESTDELLEVCKDKEMSDAPVEGELVEDKTKPSDEPPEPLREDPCSSNSEDVQASETDQATVSVEEKEEETESRDKEKTKKGRSKKQEPVVASVQEIDDAPEEQPVLQIPGSGRRNEASYTPTRRTTRARAVTFISPVPEEVHDEEGKPEQEVKMEQDQEPTVAVATSPGRSTKRSKQVKESIIGTPRRSTRRTQPEPEPEPEAPTEQKEDKVENVSDNTVSSTTRTLSPGRKWGSQRNPSRTSKQHHSEEDEASPEAKVKQEMAETHAVAKSSARGKTPTKRKAAQSTTPRRSSRITVSLSEDAPQLLEVLKEEVEEQELVSTTPAKRSSRKTKAASLLSTAVEENDKKHQTPNLGRTTRQSNRITPSVYPQVKLVPVLLPQSVKRRGVKGQDQSEPEPKQEADALRKTKKKLWDHPEEEQPLLDHPLEVPSETPVADVLIKRLQDEEQKQEVTKSPTRTSKRLTKSVVDPEPPFENSVVFDPDDKSGPGESSFIYSPSRRRTRAKAAESPSQIAPVTRSRRNVSTVDAVPPEDEMAVEVEEAKVSNTRKTSKRTAKSKALLEPALIAEVDLLSPLPSPADLVPRAQKRTKEAEGPTSTMNLRRKRIMDTVLTKPVTRRKKL
ncbi:protein ELYS [Boleophthalmus pectinirostris]|uniref:protein ELYS n=1 Tax=Boleophthalmus pectinirostris TaxID=150288 RepID=UPI00242F57FF|nr:protein ELYS [Boleophthalmus pectinirostris]